MKIKKAAPGAYLSILPFLAVGEYFPAKQFRLTLHRPVGETDKVIEDGQSVGLWPDIGGDQPFAFVSQLHVGEKSVYQLGSTRVIDIAFVEKDLLRHNRVKGLEFHRVGWRHAACRSAFGV